MACKAPACAPAYPRPPPPPPLSPPRSPEPPPPPMRRLVGGSSPEGPKGSVALALCTTVHPLRTRFVNILGTSVSETTRRPNPGGTSSTTSSFSATRRSSSSASLASTGLHLGFGHIVSEIEAPNLSVKLVYGWHKVSVVRRGSAAEPSPAPPADVREHEHAVGGHQACPGGPRTAVLGH